jgi:hypothetical protein|nr:MAG TPA_asm: hypothetical protein [Bacteriophage sp.]
MIKPETANRREIHRQAADKEAGHDEHTQKGARSAQKAARRHLKGKG